MHGFSYPAALVLPFFIALEAATRILTNKNKKSAENTTAEDAEIKNRLASLESKLALISTRR